MGKLGVESAARIAMTGGRPQRLQRDPEPGPGDLARRDGIADRDSVIAAAHVAGAGETLLQHGTHEDGAIEGPVQSGVREPVFGGVHAAGQPGRDVDMAVDKARHHGLAGEIDDLGTGWFDKAGLNRGDAVVVDEDGNLVARRIGHAVEQCAGVDHHVAGEGGCREQRNDQCSARGEFH